MSRVFTMGQLVKRLGLHEQTVREYERHGLLKPKRDSRNHRIFSESDTLRVAVVIKLTAELGLNLAGVKLVLSLARRLNMNDDELLDFVEDHRFDLKK